MNALSQLVEEVGLALAVAVVAAASVLVVMGPIVGLIKLLQFFK
jgi:hypothetical protein